MIAIRNATAEDATALLLMMPAFNAAEGIPWRAREVDIALRRLLADATLGFVFVAQVDAAAAGYAVVTWNFDLEWPGRDAFVTELWVDPEHRGQGIARRLLAASAQHATEHGAHALHLLVSPTNRAAIGLYEGAGFERVPRAVMTKKLRA